MAAIYQARAGVANLPQSVHLARNSAPIRDKIGHNCLEK